MRQILRRSLFALLVFAGAASFFLLSAPVAHAVSNSVSISPSGPKYYNDSYSVGVTVSNDRSTSISVTNDWWYSVNGGGWIYWTSASGSVGPNSSSSWTQSSSAPGAGTTVSFAINSFWGGCPEADGTWNCQQSTASFTAQERPTASASISLSSPSAPIPYNSAAYLSVSSSNANNCSVSGGGSWYYHDPYYSSGTWYTGSLTSDSTFTVSCSGASGATNSPSSSVTVSVQPQPPSLSVSASVSNSTPPPNTANSYTLSGTITNTGGSYSGTNCWEYGVDGGGRTNYCWQNAGSGTSVTSYTGPTGAAASTVYNFYLCANGNSTCSSAGNVTVTKVNPVITWSNFSMPYGGSITAATANVAGTFTYATASYNVGTRDITATFTPTDTAYYNTVSRTVSMTVTKATPVITWGTPAAITYGTALSSTQLNATANVAGTFTYNPASGTVLNANETDSQALAVSFVPTDTTNYNNASRTVYIWVNKASQSISFSALGNKTLGGAAFTVSASASSGLGVTFSSQTTGVCAVSGNTVTLVSTGTCTIRASQAGNGNYNAAANVGQTFTVTQASQNLTTTVNSGSGSFDCSTNGGVSYGACAASYTAGTTVKVRALPATNYGFSNWQICASAAGNTCTVTMDSARSVSANFTALMELTLNKTGSGTVTSTNINCGTGCSTSSYSYPSGSSVSLYATPASGWSVPATSPYGWAGCNTVSTNQGGQAICTVTMSAAKTVSVQFNQIIASASFINPANNSAISYGGGMYFQWASTGTTGCSISASPTRSGFPMTGLPSSYTGLLYYSGDFTGDTTFTLNCTLASGAGGTGSATSVMRVNPQSGSGGSAGGSYFNGSFSGTSYINGNCGIDPTTTIHSGSISGNITTPSVPLQTSPTYRNCHPWNQNCPSDWVANRDGTFDNNYRRTLVFQLGANFSNAFVSAVDLGVRSQNIEGTDGGECGFDQYNGNVLAWMWAGGLGSGSFGHLNAGSSGNFDGCAPGLACPSGTNDWMFARTWGLFDGFRSQFSSKGPNPHTMAFAGNPQGFSFTKNSPAGSGTTNLTQTPLYPVAMLVAGSDKIPAVAECGQTSTYRTVDPSVSVLESTSEASTVHTIRKAVVEPRYVEQTFNDADSSSTSFANYISSRTVRFYNIPQEAINAGICRPLESWELEMYGPGHSSAVTEYSCALGSGPVDPNGNRELKNQYTNVAGAKIVSFNMVETTLPPFEWEHSGPPGIFGGSFIDRVVDYASQVPATLVKACEVAVTPPPVMPSTNPLLVGPGVCGANVNVSWTPVTGATSYKLHRSTTGTSGSFSQLPFGSPTNLTSPYVDSRLTSTVKLSPNTTYYYQLEAVNVGGSAFSPVVSGNSSNNCYTLNVDSNLDGASSPGVTISQHSVTSGVLPIGGARVRPTTESLPNTTFGGPTDYYKIADREFTLTLEAPAERASPFGVFSGWRLAASGDLNGCDSTTAVAGDPAGMPNRRCTMSFSPTAVLTRTMNANYSGSLAAPTALTYTPSCVVGAGKVQVWMPNATASATGYRLYRASASATSFPTDSTTLVKDFTPGTPAPIASPDTPSGTPPSNAYTDSGPLANSPSETLTGGVSYQYKWVAYNNSIASPASSAAPAGASVLCPDLVVDSIKPKVGGVVPTTYYKDDLITFFADVRNAGGPTGNVSFPNAFAIYNEVGSKLSPSLPDFTITGGMNAFVGEIKTAQSDSWMGVVGNNTVKVCADTINSEIGLGRRRNIGEDNYEIPNTGETNNCRTLPISVVDRPLPTLQLYAKPAGSGTYGIYPTVSNALKIPYNTGVDLKWDGTLLKNCVASTARSVTSATDGNWAGSKVAPPPEQFQPVSGLTTYRHTYTITCDTLAPAAAGTISSSAVVYTQPDLVIASGPSVKNSPAVIRPGDALEFTAVAQNNGAYASPFYTRFLVLNAAGVPLNTPIHAASLSGLGEPGSTAMPLSTETVTGGASWTVPSGAATYTLQACADIYGPPPAGGPITSGSTAGSTNIIAESNEGNNCRTSTFSVIELPNLQANTPTIECVKVGTACAAKQPVTLRGSIKNVGPGTTVNTNNPAFGNNFYASFDANTASPTWIFLDTRGLETPALMSGNGAAHTVRSFVWGQNGEIAAGSKVWFKLCADEPPLPRGKEEETSDGPGDNCAQYPITGSDPTEFANQKPPIVDLKFNGLLSGKGGQTLVEWDAGGYFTWGTTDITSGTCVASALPAHGSWTGSKPDVILDTNTTAHTITQLKNNYDFKLTCNGLTGSDPATDSDTVRVIPLSVSCSANKAAAAIGETITWTAVVQSVSQPTLLWSIPDSQLVSGISGNSDTANPVYVNYSTAGQKQSATVTATTNGMSRTAKCTMPGCTGSNCPPVISQPPTLIVKSTRNGGETSTSPLLNGGGVAVSGNQPGTSGTTLYSVAKTDGTTVATNLTPPLLDLDGAKFKSWTGCDSPSPSAIAGDPSGMLRLCNVTVALGESQTVTANYFHPDLTASGPTPSGLVSVVGGYRNGAITLSGKANNASAEVPAAGTFKSTYSYSTNYNPATGEGAWTTIGAAQSLASAADIPPGTSGRDVLPSAVWTAPAFGNYYFRLCVDQSPVASENNTIKETNNSNNCSYSSPYAFVGEPDLTANMPTVSGANTGTPDEYWAGTPLTLSGSINNIGTAATPNGTFNNAYEFSDNAESPQPVWVHFAKTTLAVTSLPVGAGENNRALYPFPPPGQTYPVPRSSTGFWYYRTCADKPANQVAEGPSASAESDASNCSGFKKIKVVYAPDLTPVNFAATPSNSLVGATVAFTASVLNKPSANADVTPLTFDNRFEVMLPGATTWTLADTKKLDNQTGTFAVGQTRTIVPGSYTIPAATAGEYKFRICVDTPMPNGVVAEKIEGEADNCTAPTVPLTFSLVPELILKVRKNGTGTFGASVTLNYNEYAELQWTGQNLGACTAKTDTTPAPVGTANWTGPKTTPPPTQTEGNIGPMINASYTYTLSCLPGAHTGVTEPLVRSVTVTVNPPGDPTCAASPNTPTEPFINTEVIWTASGTLSNDVLSWTGTDSLTGNTSTVKKTYTNVTINPKLATLTATAPGNRVRTANCSVTVKTGPDLISSLTLSGTKPIAGGADTYYDDGTITLGGTLTNIGTAPTANGGFYNLYQYRIGSGPWVDLDAVGLATGGAVQTGTEGTRPLNPSSVLSPSSTSAGISYTYRICADQDTHSGPDKNYVASSVVPEDNIAHTAETEASNCAQKTIILKSFPDLVISRDPAPVQAGRLTDGQTYTFNGEVKNAGSYLIPSTPSFFNRFQIVKSADAGGGTVTLPNSPTISGLSVNAVQTVTSGSWTGIVGRHALTLCTDRSDTLADNNKIAESDETNNCSPATVTIDVYPATPGVTASKGSCPVNGKINLTYAPASGATTYELYRGEGSVTPTFVEAAPTVSGLRQSDSGLTPGGTYSYYVKAIGADGLSTQSPTSSAQSSSGCTSTRPDLVAMSIIPNGTLTVGSTITFTGVVKNGGGEDVEAGTTFQNSFTLTGPGTPPTFPAVQTTGLAIQESKSVTSAAWTAVAGTYTIKFCADSTNVIAETAGADNDASNCKDTVFTVTSGTTTHTLTVNVVGNGTVTGSGITDCTAAVSPCTSTIADGTSLTLTEVPGTATFSGWSGSTCSGTATTCVFTMSTDRSVTATFTGGTPPGRRTGTNPTVTCSASPSTNITQTVTSVSWNAYPRGGSGLYRQFRYEFDNDNLPSGNLDYEKHFDTAVRGTPSSEGYSYEETYPTTGTKRARVKVIDSDMRESAFADCSTIVVNELCPASESNFTLSATKSVLRMAWDGSSSDSALLTLTTAGNCPTFSSTVNLTSRAAHTGRTDGDWLEFVPQYLGQINSRRQANYHSKAPNSSARRNSLDPSTYSEGADISFTRRGSNENSIEPNSVNTTPERTYSFQVCGVASGRPESCTSLQLQVGGTPSSAPPSSGGGTKPIPQFEEF